MNSEFNILSFALEGEDLILDRYFQHKLTGFYVDIGAYHPTRYSNTYLFYLKGWHGINIDATPGSMEDFNQIRPNDINLELAISSHRSIQKYYCFEEAALNSFDEKLSRARESRGNRISQEVEVECFPLSDILIKHIPEGTEIDFMTVDVEGRDLDVLKTNDWQRFRPAMVLAECSAFGVKNGLDISEVQSSPITSFLASVGYTMFGKTFDSVLFRRLDIVINDNFLANGSWTPQTTMLRKIQDWITKCPDKAETALSIDSNPTLEMLLLQKWPNLNIQRAVYPEMDACNLDMFADNSFDLVFSHQVIEHIAKPWIAAQEMTRVLKPEGYGIHTTCAFNPRHGQPHFNDYFRFLKDGLAALFDDVTILHIEEWGNRQAILHNVSIDDGHGDLGGRRFPESIGAESDNLYPWVTWIIYKKNGPSASCAGNLNTKKHNVACVKKEIFKGKSVILEDSHKISFLLKDFEKEHVDILVNRDCDNDVFGAYQILLKPGNVVFDIGAHVGRYSVFPSRIVGSTGHVYSFEPVEDNYWQLNVTIALNRCKNIKTVNLAMCDKVGETTINLFSKEFSSWSSLGKPEMTSPDGTLLKPIREQKISCDTVDNYCSAHDINDINFLKIDVEGFELSVLKGAARMLQQHCVDYICFEISDKPLKAAGVLPEQIKDFLAGYGYKIYAIQGTPYRFIGPIDDLSCYYNNFYASHHDLLKY